MAAKAAPRPEKVYGTPEQIAALYETIERITAREPAGTFEEEAVRGTARALAETIRRRLLEEA